MVFSCFLSNFHNTAKEVSLTLRTSGPSGCTGFRVYEMNNEYRINISLESDEPVGYPAWRRNMPARPADRTNSGRDIHCNGVRRPITGAYDQKKKTNLFGDLCLHTRFAMQ